MRTLRPWTLGFLLAASAFVAAPAARAQPWPIGYLSIWQESRRDGELEQRVMEQARLEPANAETELARARRR